MLVRKPYGRFLLGNRNINAHKAFIEAGLKSRNDALHLLQDCMKNGNIASRYHGGCLLVVLRQGTKFQYCHILSEATLTLITLSYSPFEGGRKQVE